MGRKVNRDFGVELRKGHIIAMTENRKGLREFWIDKVAFFATTRGHYAKYIAYDSEMEKPKNLLHVREVSPELDAAYIEMEKALESIASLHMLRQSEEKYWLDTPHHAVAEVAANDTKLAREILAKLRVIRGEK